MVAMRIIVFSYFASYKALYWSFLIKLRAPKPRGTPATSSATLWRERDHQSWSSVSLPTALTRSWSKRNAHRQCPTDAALLCGQKIWERMLGPKKVDGSSSSTMSSPAIAWTAMLSYTKLPLLWSSYCCIQCNACSTTVARFNCLRHICVLKVMLWFKTLTIWTSSKVYSLYLTCVSPGLSLKTSSPYAAICRGLHSPQFFIAR